MLVRTPHQGGVRGVGSSGQCWGGAWVKGTWLPGASAGHEGAVPEDCPGGSPRVGRALPGSCRILSRVPTANWRAQGRLIRRQCFHPLNVVGFRCLPWKTATVCPLAPGTVRAELPQIRSRHLPPSVSDAEGALQEAVKAQ